MQVTYTTLPVSRLLASKVPEVTVCESQPRYCGGHTWYDEDEDGIHKDCEETAPVLGEDCYCESAGLVCEKTYNAYRLDDCIRAIKVYGEKKYIGYNPLFITDILTTKCDRLLTAYLASDCNMADPRVSEVIIGIFK
jgi:hypothetical protein